MNAEMNTIIREIVQAESSTTAEIHVHLSRKWLERDAVRSARAVFARYGLERTTQRNAVLLYLNLRKRKFAIVPDGTLASSVGPAYWDELANSFRDDLLSTRYENAVALAVRTLGITLAEKFPREFAGGAPDPS